MAVENPQKAAVIQEYRRHETDNGSSEVQVAILTQRIRHLTAHLKQFPKDHATRRGLLKLVGRRSALVRYLARHDAAGYKELIARLGIRR
jgi:small subunit ribosomal protein S15